MGTGAIVAVTAGTIVVVVVVTAGAVAVAVAVTAGAIVATCTHTSGPGQESANKYWQACAAAMAGA